MSKAEEKTTELMKKAKDFIPDGGYSEKELNIAFFMFIKGYHQAEQDLALTLEDINNIIDLYNVVSDEGKFNGREEFYKEVLRRFNEIKQE